MAGDYNTKCGVQVNYQSMGSGGGVKDWQTKHGRLAAPPTRYLADSEIALPPEWRASRNPGHVRRRRRRVQPDRTFSPTQMTPAIIANIFLGKITTWNDPALPPPTPA